MPWEGHPTPTKTREKPKKNGTRLFTVHQGGSGGAELDRGGRVHAVTDTRRG